jgi:hypothetical protein
VGQPGVTRPDHTDIDAGKEHGARIGGYTVQFAQQDLAK